MTSDFPGLVQALQLITQKSDSRWIMITIYINTITMYSQYFHSPEIYRKQGWQHLYWLRVWKNGEFDRDTSCSRYNAPTILITWSLTCRTWMEWVTLQTPHTRYRTSRLSVQPNISHPEDIPNHSAQQLCWLNRGKMSTVLRSLSRLFYWNTTKQWSTKRIAK